VGWAIVETEKAAKSSSIKKICLIMMGYFLITVAKVKLLQLLQTLFQRILLIWV